ncbi:MAG: YafY family protein [bacterium]|nr:YafY family protein [bacterium]
MRADRLLSILLLLQTHQRMTARELAERLEVSERTIHRDMEALSAAGVPVLAERGVNGGWSLLEDYRTDLTGLNDSEIQALFLTTPAHLLSDLGLRQAYEAALVKLMAALPSGNRRSAEDIRQRVLIDVPGWHPSKSDDQQPCFPVIQQAVLEDRRAMIHYSRDDTTVERLIDPLGLVAKGHLWYLVAAVEGELRTYRVSRIQGVELLDQRCQRPAGFDLAAYWAESAADFVARLPHYTATVRIHRDYMPRVRGMWRFARVQHIDPPDADGWHCAVVDFEVIDEAVRYILSAGTAAEAVEPLELREAIRQAALEIAGRYAH